MRYNPHLPPRGFRPGRLSVTSALGRRDVRFKRGLRAMAQHQNFEYRIGDEVSFAAGHGMQYGEVVRIITPGPDGAIEIQWEDGRREVKKTRDRAIRLLRRASGVSEMDEVRGPRRRRTDDEIAEVRRGDVRRRHG
ncbi:hypothetical protein J8C02_10320 [Chloracidobacterium sp. MS 40/45]|uniref:hypothetical protein n=1 Tax=Chloracidobacterium aggregatum TaxID=2851959 RepID=UPI001B8B75EB|nr:hypothetical protein [Chloracidobacterium aggregatum]QUV99794.1 hypothetical protein J8C02_10320 [Chloracidobacterium sp. MS 40/45]